MPNEKFDGTLVTVSLMLPVDLRRSSKSSRHAVYGAIVVDVMTSVRLIKSLTLGVRDNGTYIDVTIMPSKDYSWQDAQRDLNRVGRRFNAMHPESLAEDWANTPESERRRIRIPRANP